MIEGSDSIAAERNESPGRKRTTYSGEGWSLAPVFPAGEGLDVPAHLGGMFLQLGEPAGGVLPRTAASRNASVGALASTTIRWPPGSETTRSGRMMRPESSLKPCCTSKSQCLHHAGHLFDHAAQLHLPPGPGGPGRAEGARELGRLGVQPQLGHAERFDLAAEIAVGPLALELQVDDLRVDLLERFPERLDDGVDGLLAAGEVPSRPLVELGERLLGKL